MADAQYLLRFRDDFGNARDVEVSAGSDGLYRFAGLDKTEAEPHHSAVTGVAISATEDVYNSGALPDGIYLMGVMVTGDTDGLFRVLKDSEVIGFKAINVSVQDALIDFPSPVYIPADSTLTITITNTGIQAGAYEAVRYILR